MQTLHARLIIAVAREAGDAPFVVEAGPRHVAAVAVDVVEEAFFGVVGAEAAFDVEDAIVVFEEFFCWSYDPEATVDPMAAQILIVFGWGVSVALP